MRSKAWRTAPMVSAAVGLGGLHRGLVLAGCHRHRPPFDMADRGGEPDQRATTLAPRRSPPGGEAPQPRAGISAFVAVLAASSRPAMRSVRLLGAQWSAAGLDGTAIAALGSRRDRGNRAVRCGARAGICTPMLLLVGAAGGTAALGSLRSAHGLPPWASAAHVVWRHSVRWICRRRTSQASATARVPFDRARRGDGGRDWIVGITARLRPAPTRR